MWYAASLAGLLLSAYHVAAFITHSSCIRSTAATSRRQHDTSPLSCSTSTCRSAVSAMPLAKPTRRRHTYHTMAASGTPADSGESADSEDGGTDEERSIPEGTDTIPIDCASDNNSSSDTTSPEATEAAVDSASKQEATAVSESDAVKQQDAVEERREGSGEEETEDDGEPLFLPSGDNKDFRLFRAKLRAGSDEKWQEQLKRNVNEAQLSGQDAWAHELSAPENGCLIIAKSGSFNMAQTYFNEAVIFLASHDEAGSAGFILNRPTTVCLGDLVEGNALPQFSATPLYLGGDVGEGNVQILHPYSSDVLPGAMEIVPGVYIGGAVEDADRMVATGRAKRDDFRFFLHLCGWAPGQLEAEIERGVWLPAASSANVITKHCLGLPVPMWREVMTLMGPKYGLLARDTYDDL